MNGRWLGQRRENSSVIAKIALCSHVEVKLVVEVGDDPIDHPSEVSIVDGEAIHELLPVILRGNGMISPWDECVRNDAHSFVHSLVRSHHSFARSLVRSFIRSLAHSLALEKEAAHKRTSCNDIKSFVPQCISTVSI